MNIVERVVATGLPLDEIIVIGSGVMDVLGLRKAVDIDLVVTPRIYEQLQQSGDYHDFEIRPGDVLLEKDDQEIALTWARLQDTLLDYQALFKESVVIDGVRFVSPEFLLKVKQIRNRPKDHDDIRLLEAYLA